MPGLATERLEAVRDLKFLPYVANCSVEAERCALRGTVTGEVAVLLPFMSADVLGWSIAPKKSVLSVLHELAQSVQKNIYILKWDCMRVRSVYRSSLGYKDNTQLVFEHAVSCFECPKIMHVVNCTTTVVGWTVASLMISMLVYN